MHKAEVLQNIHKHEDTGSCIYWMQDSTCQIALLEKEGVFRNYGGIKMDSSNPNWFPGQIKLDLRHAGPLIYICQRARLLINRIYRQQEYMDKALENLAGDFLNQRNI